MERWNGGTVEQWSIFPLCAVSAVDVNTLSAIDAKKSGVGRPGGDAAGADGHGPVRIANTLWVDDPRLIDNFSVRASNVRLARPAPGYRGNGDSGGGAPSRSGVRAVFITIASIE